MYDDEIQEILNKINIFEKMYETIRLIDPIHKKLVDYKNNSIDELNINCFDFWGRSKICNNCISIRAFNENETFVKVEYSKDKIHMVTAIPVQLSDRRIVIELLKDTTNSMVFGAGEEKDSNESPIYAMIDNMNILALKDALTGVYNRRYINEKFPIELINSAISEQKLSIILADIDFFKKINDNYGHLAGDFILKSFSNVLSGCIQGENGWIARFGGEEFLICLPNTGLERAVEIAQLMRKLIEEQKIIYAENTLKITSSFGVYSAKPKQGDSIEDLIDNADKKLYLAKNNGRNRVEY